MTLLDAGRGEPLSTNSLAPLSGTAVVGEFLLEELSVLVAVAVEGLVLFQKCLDFVLRQTALFIGSYLGIVLIEEKKERKDGNVWYKSYGVLEPRQKNKVWILRLHSYNMSLFL